MADPNFQNQPQPDQRSQYGGPPPPYYPPPPPQVSTVVFMGGMSVLPHSFDPVQMTCPNCRNSIITNVHYVAGLLTWIVCLVTELWCVLCMDCTKDAEHTCPVCGQHLGRVRRL